MALNFPSNTTQPYIDPVSGLKYIFNTAVGAWETAIQPPVIVSPDIPSISIPGFLWWDTESGTLFVRYQDNDSSQWVEAVPSPDVDRNIYMADNPPPNPNKGDMWWCTKGNDGGFFGGGRLYIFFVDSNGEDGWIEASPNVGGGSGGGAYEGPTVSSGATPPVDPNENDIWYDSSSGQEILKIYVSGSWVDCIDINTFSNIVVSVSTNYPIENTGTSNRPIIGIKEATTTSLGSAQYATQVEVNAGAVSNRAITPSTLSSGITRYLPDATESRKGVIQLASQYEVNQGNETTKAVTPRTLKSSLGALGVTGNPIGTVISFAGTAAPTGYLICDGSETSRIDYDDLYSVVGTTYGSGNGTTTFNLPDLRGEFIRGWSAAGGTQKPGVDENRTFGSSQGQSVESHAHSVVTGPASTSGLRQGGGNRAADTGSENTNFFPTDPTSETRPRNIAMLYCIKF